METYTCMKYADLRFPKAWGNGMLTMRNGIRISWRNFWGLIESGIDMFAYDDND